MKRFLIIAGWEFVRHLRTRSFFLATFVTPVLFAGMVLIPSIYYKNSQMMRDQVIGMIEVDTTGFYPLLSERLAGSLNHPESNGNILLKPIEADTSFSLRSDIVRLEGSKKNLDSLNTSYNKVKERRRYIFQRPASRKRARDLSASYQQMRDTRESRDLAEISYNRMKSRLDSLMQKSLIAHADSLVRVREISGYLLISSNTFLDGVIEFHSEQPINFLRLKPLQDALQVIQVENRMRQEGITVSKIQELLQPIEIREFMLEGSSKHEFDPMITYLAPIVAVLFLFISIFTSSGFHFSSILNEKANHILETLVASVRPLQLVGGKIMGLAALGMLQVLIWFGVTMMLIGLGVLSTEKIRFLTFNNAGLFFFYFLLGHLFFSAIFTGISALSSSEKDAHNLTQFMRLLSVIPITLVIIVLLSPDALVVRFLSYIPFLAPTFMILRTPLGQPPMIDYYISSIILLISIIIAFIVAIRIFKIAALRYEPGISMRSLVNSLRNS